MQAVNGMSIHDVATVMECPENTVRSRKILAINKLRKALQGLLVL